MAATPPGEPATHPYTLMASAIGGRVVAVHWHENPAHGAWTDNRSIFLPALDTGRSHLFDLIAQALLIRGGSLARAHVARLFGNPRAARRYLFAEVVRGTRVLADILPRAFCEHAAIAAFPRHTASAEESYRLAMSATTLPEPPVFIGTLRAVPILRNTLPDAARAALSKRQREGHMDFSSTPGMTEDEAETAEESKLLKLFQTPLFANRALSDLLRNLLGAARSGKPDESPDASGGDEMPVSSIQRVTTRSPFAALADLARELVVPHQPDDSGSRSYPEWDAANGAYRPRWVLVDETDPWRQEPDTDGTLDRLLLPAPPLLKRRLAGIGLAMETHRRQPEGEDYSVDRVIDYCVDVARGNAPDERVYQRLLKTRRDLGVMILLDVSGSTAERSASGVSIHHRQAQLAYQLTDALHALGDHVALYAYHSWGRSLVRLLRLKSFDEAGISSRVRERFRQLEPAGFTRTGAALRHAARLLTEQTRLPWRILIVITDGFAYDHDYEGRHAEEDTKKALEEIRATGTGCLCLTIGSEQDEAKLREVFSAASTLSARDYADFLAGIRPAMLGAVVQTRRRRD